jgi:hypothetical protein
MKVPEEREDSRVGLIRVVGDDTVLVSVRTRQDWIPAQHVYLHIPSETIGGHPFTVCNISRPLTQADNERPYESTQELLIRVREGMTKQLFKVGSGVRDEQGVAEGWIGNEREGVPIKAWTEGPCTCFFPSLAEESADGHRKYLGEDNDTLVLISGGAGVSYGLPNALDIVRRARAMKIGATDRSIAVATQRLSFIWVVKKPGE